jgi:hypothetical protein
VVSLVAQQEGQVAVDVECALWQLLLDVDDLSVSTGDTYIYGSLHAMMTC